MNFDEFSRAFREKPEPEPCAGQRYRYKEFGFPTKRGGFKNGFELIPLKRESCPGCEYCHGGHGITDGLSDDEYRIEVAENVVDNDIVALDVVVDSTDWETGYADSWHVIARRTT